MKKRTSKITSGATNKQQTNNKQTTTNKNEKNDKKEEEVEEEKNKNCISFYMENINPLITQHEVNTLNDYNKDLSDELIIYAMKDAIEHKARNMKYIKKILNRYIQEGIKTVEQIDLLNKDNQEDNYENEITYTAEDFTPEQYDRLMRREMTKEEMIQILKEKKNV